MAKAKVAKAATSALAAWPPLVEAARQLGTNADTLIHLTIGVILVLASLEGGRGWRSSLAIVRSAFRPSRDVRAGLARFGAFPQLSPCFASLRLRK